MRLALRRSADNTAGAKRSKRLFTVYRLRRWTGRIANVRFWPQADIDTISQGAMDGAASVPIENALFHRHAGERESGGEVSAAERGPLSFTPSGLSRGA